jgi:hypothetical protein
MIGADLQLALVAWRSAANRPQCLDCVGAEVSAGRKVDKQGPDADPPGVEKFLSEGRHASWSIRPVTATTTTPSPTCAPALCSQRRGLGA